MYDFLCAEHGGLGHVFVHEAAHAVAAVQRRIAFTEVRILPPDQWVSAHDGLMLGGVSTIDEAQSWVQADPVGSMEFVLADAITEQGYGRCLEGAYTGDVAVGGSELASRPQPTQGNRRPARPIAHARHIGCRTVAVANWPSIRRVAGRLTESTTSPRP